MGRTMFFIIIQVFVLLVYTTCCDCRVKRQSNNLDNLELIHVIFRHGDRTPDKSIIYKNDPHINATYYPIGHGQLTNAGKRKEFQIGKALRKRYYNFLAKNFTLDTVDARSSDYNRTKMSLQLVLASLFPPRGEYVWRNRFNWQPVPFNYWPVEEDHILADPFKNCPKYLEKFYEYLNSTDGRTKLENYRGIIEYLREKTGEDLASKSFSDLYFTLTTEQENGYKNPDWALKNYHHIKDLAILDYNVSTATEDLKRYTSGFLVKKILDDTLYKIKGTYNKDTKIFLYSAHEVNIAFILRFFDIFYPHIPPYGSYITFEIHNYNGVRGIKIYYQDYTSESPKRIKIPGCENFCRLDKFIRLYNHQLPVSEKECFYF